MRTIGRIVLASVIVCCTIVTASASGLIEGRVYDGYTYRGGLFHYNGNSYTRAWVNQWRQDYRGYWYDYGHYSYQAVQLPQYQAPPLQAPENWRAEVLKLAAKKEDDRQYFEALRALGYNVQSSYYQSQAVASGQTVYQRSNSVDVYGDFNLAQLYQQAGRLTENTLSLSQQAMSGHAELVGRAGSERARIAEIIAKGQAAVALAQSLKAGDQTRIETREKVRFQAQQPPSPQPGHAPPGNGAGIQEQAKSALIKLMDAKCAQCHSNDSKKTTFRTSLYFSYSEQQKEGVITRLTTLNPKLRMPRDESGDPHELSPSELKLFFRN